MSIGGGSDVTVTCEPDRVSCKEMQKIHFQSPMSRPPRSDLYKHPLSLCSPRLPSLPSYPCGPPYSLPSTNVRGRLLSLRASPLRRVTPLLFTHAVFFFTVFLPAVHIAAPIVKTPIFPRPAYHQPAVLFHLLISGMLSVEKFRLCFRLLSA